MVRGGASRLGRKRGEGVERSAGQQPSNQAGGNGLADPVPHAGRHQPGNLSW
jgi:hypothetical protein